MRVMIARPLTMSPCCLPTPLPPPLRAPAWLGRLLGGAMTVSMMTDVRGASNTKAKRELGWIPAYPSWRDGFPAWAQAFKSRKAA